MRSFKARVGFSARVTLSVSSPAKLNLFLAVTGRREDGFHELVSVAAPVEFGDELDVSITSDAPGVFTLSCNDPEVPADESNLVLKAARAFARATGVAEGAAFILRKRVPHGAGLGGGSSNAVAALKALNELHGCPLDLAALAALAGEIGSDCPLFLQDRPVIMRGRGERISPLPEAARGRLAGRRVLIFKPSFPVSTRWAYERMAQDGSGYLPVSEAEQRLAAWIDAPAEPVDRLLFNNMEGPVFTKYLALPLLLDLLAKEFALAPRMSGSGSACYCFLREDSPMADIVGCIQSAWGQASVVAETRLRS